MFHATTILAVRHGSRTVLAGDGQVTLGNTVVKTGARVRLVKGAYLEPPSEAFQRKEDVDANFVRLSETLLSIITHLYLLAQQSAAADGE